MRKTCLTPGLAGMIILLFSIPSLHSHAQTTFEKIYWTGEYDVSNNVELTSDGGYMLVGQSGPVYDTCICDMILVKCDADGNIEWSNRYGSENCDQGWDVKQTDDGGYIVTGVTIDILGNSYMVLMKTDASGEIEWQSLYQSNFHDEGNAIFETDDGGYLVSGYRYNFSAFAYDMSLTKFDSAGSVIWSKVYLTPDAEYGQIQLFDNGDNTFYLVAVEVITSSFPMHEDFLVMRIDAEGQVISSRTYGNAESNEKGWGIVKIDANRYWLIGTGGPQSHTDALLIQIDSSGNVAWAKVYGSGVYAADESSVTSYTYNPEHGLYVCGFDAFYNPYTFIIDLGDAFVFRVNDDGEVAWWEDFGTPEIYYWEEFRRMKVTSDGGLLLAGSRTVYGNYEGGEHWDMYAVKTNSIGQNGCEMNREVNVTDFDVEMNEYEVTDSSITLTAEPAAFAIYPGVVATDLCSGFPSSVEQNVSDGEFQLLPNPASESVRLKGMFPAGSQLNIFDMTGSLIYESKNPLAAVSVSSFTDGLYLARVQSSDGKIRGIGKFIVAH